MKALLKYPGAKNTLAPWIISHFPAHTYYIEPYFGSGAVFFNKAPARHEVVNDISGDIVNLFRVIREQGEDLAALISMTPWAREEYEQSYEATEDPIERARRFVVRVNQSHGFFTKVQKHGWSIGATGDSGARRTRSWEQLPETIRCCARRLALAHIAHDDALSLLRLYRRPDALIYADPTYVLSARRGRKFYQHEMTDADHVALLDALNAHPGPVVLSGYHCPLYDDRLAHWQTKERKAQAEKGQSRIEVLWLNPICRERLGSLFQIAP